MAFLTGSFGPTHHYPAFLRAIGDVQQLEVQHLGVQQLEVQQLEVQQLEVPQLEPQLEAARKDLVRQQELIRRVRTTHAETQVRYSVARRQEQAQGESPG